MRLNHASNNTSYIRATRPGVVNPAFKIWWPGAFVWTAAVCLGIGLWFVIIKIVAIVLTYMLF